MKAFTYLSVDPSNDGFRHLAQPGRRIQNAPLALTPGDENLIARANQAIGRLEGIRSTLPDAKLFTYFYVRKEAVLSAQTEGTQSSLPGPTSLREWGDAGRATR